jgi:hypothetical protein
MSQHRGGIVGTVWWPLVYTHMCACRQPMCTCVQGYTHTHTHHAFPVLWPSLIPSTVERLNSCLQWCPFPQSSNSTFSFLPARHQVVNELWLRMTLGHAEDGGSGPLRCSEQIASLCVRTGLCWIYFLSLIFPQSGIKNWCLMIMN